MTELAKTFDPAAIEARWYAHWEERGLFRPSARRRDAVHDRHAAAQRHRQPAYRPCARQYAAGHPRPPRAAAGQGCACGWSAPTMPGSRRRWWSSASSTREQKKRTDLGREAFIDRVWEWKARKRRADHAAAAPPRRVVRLGQRALHDGRGLFEGRHPRVRRAAQARAALSRQAPRQLGPAFPDRDQRPRGRDARGAGQVLDLALSARRRQRPRRGRHHAARDDARRHGGRGPSRRCALHRAGRQDGPPADHRPRDPDRRRRTCRPRTRLGRGQDHPGARLQRL